MRKTVALVLFSMLFSVRVAGAVEDAGKEKAVDHGEQPWVVDIEALTMGNDHFRAANWTGKHLQMTVMSIEPGGEIGLEKHDDGDQFIRVEGGTARVVMGPSRDSMAFEKTVSDDWAIFIPAGAWHNIINVGVVPLKVYVIYAPPEHPAGTLHGTFEESMAEHGH